MDDNIIPHLMDIKERLASVEATTKDIKEDVKECRNDIKEGTERINAVEATQDSQSGALKVMRWVLGIALGIPGLLFTITRLMAGG